MFMGFPYNETLQLLPPTCLLCQFACLTSPLLSPCVLIPNALEMVLSCFSLKHSKPTQPLTQIVSHPVLWHYIEPILLGCTLSLHRHRDKPLMSLHLYLRLTCVSSKSKNERFKPYNSGPDCSVIVLDGICTLLIYVISHSELSETSSKIEPSGTGAVIRIGPGLMRGAIRTQRLAERCISALNITHRYFPSLLPLCHYLSLS
jgi:hypothetical protein